MFVYKTRPPTRFLTPDLAILDPELTRSMPPSLTAATAMDALSHAVEALTGSQSSPYSDALALQAVGLIVGNVQVAADDGENMSARGALMVAANLAGLAFNHSMVGCGHGMAHALGGLYGIPHGVANALVLRQALEYNFPYIEDKLAAWNKPSTPSCCATFLLPCT